MVYVPSDFWEYFFKFQRQQRYVTAKQNMPLIKQPTIILALNGIDGDEFFEISVALPRKFHLTWMIWNAPYSNEVFFRTTFEQILNIHEAELDPWHGSLTVNQFGKRIRPYTFELIDEDVWATSSDEED